MKRIIINLVLLACVMVSCKKEIDTPQIIVESNVITQFSFSVDESKKVERTLDKETKMTVEDDNCGSWEIIAPLQLASMHEVNITAVPMVNIEADPEWGTALAGIKFEPSGIHFSEPLTVKISIENDSGGTVVFMMVDDDGNATEIPQQSKNGNEYTVQVDHFSGMIITVPDDLAKMCNDLHQQRSIDIEAARALLTNNPRTGVEPISYEKKCDESNSRLLSLNVQQMMEPECTAIKNILTSGRGVSIVCNDENHQGFPEILKQLSEQLVKKAKNAINDYGNQPEKYAAIINLALTVDRNHQLLGFSEVGTNSDLFQACIRLAENSIKEYKKKIVEEHDYQYIGMFSSIHCDLARITGKGNIEDFIKELENMLRFKLEIEVGVFRENIGPDWSQKDYSLTKGFVDFLIETKDFTNYKIYPSPGFDYRLIGEGLFFTEGNSINKSTQNPDYISTLRTEEFIKKYEVEFNFCDYIGKLHRPLPGIYNEGWEGDEFLAWSLNFASYTNYTCMSIYDSNSLPTIDFKIKNRDKVLIDDVDIKAMTYDDGSTAKIEYVYKITHDPK